ncbi:MAG: hypothetical protein Kow0022_09420 [Phycisphaerales bacterium]
MVLPGLQNVRALSPGVYCGSVPEGEAGFQSLQLLDVRSVISVDGARPDVGAARARGLSYAHIPIRYSGISDEAAVQLAAAVRDLPGPVYIHCHHGRHRGPAAACLALVELGVISPQRGVELLEAAGTSHDYPGLYAAVAQAGRIDDAALRGVAAELPAAAPVPGFVAAMSGIEVTFGHLRAVERAGWGPPEDHPDLVPAAEAGMLHDLFRAAQADTQVPSAQDDFARWLAQSIERSARLEEAIAAGDARQASAELATLSNLCTQCHVRYRD